METYNPLIMYSGIFCNGKFAFIGICKIARRVSLTSFTTLRFMGSDVTTHIRKHTWKGSANCVWNETHKIQAVCRGVGEGSFWERVLAAFWKPWLEGGTWICLKISFFTMSERHGVDSASSLDLEESGLVLCSSGHRFLVLNTPYKQSVKPGVYCSTLLVTR